MDIHYLDALFADSIANPNFFNGRILTAQDMQDAQRAARTRTLRLGQAVGEGVAYGLGVTAAGDKLVIGAGLALNRCGEPLLLSADVTLALTVSTPAVATMDSPFAPCDLDPGLLVTSTINAEFLLLLITSATRYSTDQTANSGINGNGGGACTSRYEQEGIQFKLAPLADYFTASGAEARWQSLLANLCFGTDALLTTASAPFAAPARYGLVDDLRADGLLTDCDVPLAVLRWRNRTVQFVDQWAVRRPCFHLLAAPLLPPSVSGFEPFAQHATLRRASEAQARFLQFQEQIERLRTTLPSPHTAAAATHFTHLPAAGYLRLRADVAGNAGKGFQSAAFFQGTFTPQPLDPAYLRALLHDSFYVDPLPVLAATPLAVDLYQVEGSDPQQPYVLFVRHRPLIIVEPPEEEPPIDEETPLPTADLFVAVTDSQGNLLSKSQVAQVTATLVTGTGKVIGGRSVEKRTELGGLLAAESVYEQFIHQFTPKKRASSKAVVIDLPSLTPAVYLFPALPIGAYTVAALPALGSDLQGNSAIIQVRVRQPNTLRLTLTPKKGTTPGGINLPDEGWVLPGGPRVDKIYIDPKWKDLLLNPRHPPVPDPEEWWTDPPPDVAAGIKAVISEVIAAQPQIALEGSHILVRPDYDPAQVYSEPYAYLGTADGAYFPLILVSDNYALAGDVAAVRSGIQDLDAVAFNTALRGAGLQNLEALTGAWGGLISQTLKLDTGGATGLIEETRTAAQTLQSSFARYPGIDPAASDRLKQSFADDVALANADPAAVTAALGASYTIGFASRLIDRARNAVAPNSWLLDNLGFSADERSQLATVGVRSKGDFVALAGSDEGRKQLSALLGIDTAGLTRFEENALAGMVGGRHRVKGKAGVAGVRGVTDAMAGSLVAAGIKSATDLASAERGTLVTLLGISAAEANELVVNATATSGAFTLLASNLGLSEENVTALRNQGITSVGDLARADRTTLGNALGNTALGDRLANVTKQVFGGR